MKKLSKSNFVLLICAVVIFLQVKSFGQLEPIVTYDAATKKIDTIYFNSVSGLRKSEVTSSYRGSDTGFSLLDTVKPASPFRNAGFTELKPASLFFPLNNYPIRTTVKLLIQKAGKLKQLCSGQIVSKNLVLTSWHCVCAYEDTTGKNPFRDSMLISPAFDKSKPNPLYSKIKVIKTYIPLSNIDDSFSKDIAIIKTAEPIGLITGWIGIGFNDDEEFFKSKVFHKFSYPGTVDLYDTTRVFNGDTLYYNYGKLDLVSDKDFGYGIVGIRGQSGSSLLYTDNNIYYSLGVMNWSYMSLHYRLQKDVFYPFKNIIEEENLLASAGYDNIYDFDLMNAYPNPYNSTTNIIYTLRKGGYVSLRVYDLLGNEIAAIVDGYQGSGKYRVPFTSRNMTSGVYFFRLQVDGFSKTGKVIYLK